MVRHYTALHFGCYLSVLALLIFGVGRCAAQEDNSIWYYRILVPQDRIADWPFDGEEPYHAFDKKLFEEITAPQRSDQQKIADSLLQNAIHTVQLNAELRGGNCLEGQGHFLIRNSVFSLGKQAETFSVPLKPLGLWAENPKTADGAELHFATVEDTIFLNFPPSFPKPTNNNELTTVDFQWTLRGQKEGREKLVFHFRTPLAPRVEWMLRLPAQWTPSISDGMVQEIVAPDSQESPARYQRAGEQNRSQRIWRISPGGRVQTQLTILSSENAETEPVTLPIRQNIAYDIRPEGLDVKSVVSLPPEIKKLTSTQRTDPEIARSTDFVISLDEPLRMRSVLWGNQFLTATIINEGTRQGVRQFLVSIPAGEGRLIVNAFCPVQTDQKWNLPRIRFQSEKYFWAESKSDLFVKDPLIVYALEPDQAIQTQPVDAPEGSDRWTGSRYSFQYFTPDSQIAADLTFDSPGLAVKTGTIIQWEEEQVTGTMSLDLTPMRQNAKIVELVIQPSWSIDLESIESIPKDEFLHWEGKPSDISNDSANAPSSKSLFVYLQRPTKLKLTGTRPNPKNPELTFGDLIPVRVNLPEKSRQIGKSGPGIASDISSGKHLVALVANSPNRLRPVGTIGQILQPMEITDPLVRECFFPEIPTAGNGSIYVLDSNSRSIPIVPEHQKLRFESRVDCRLTLQSRELLQTCTFLCTPMGNRIDKFYVHFTQKSEFPWQWTMKNGERAPNNRMLSEQERAKADIAAPPGGVVWEIQLGTPRSGFFQLDATRRVPLDRAIVVPLPMLPESSLKQVDVMIDSPYSTDVDVINSGLNSIPVAAPPKNEYQTVRAAFRYDPQRDTDNPEKPLLLLKPKTVAWAINQAGLTQENTLSQSAWVWTLQLDTQFESTGVIREHATFFLENRGQKQITISLPPLVPLENVLAVWVENERVTWNPQQENDEEKEADRRISLTLPPKRRFPVVSLEYWHTSQPLVYRNKIRPSFPTIDLPTLGGTWIAWTPPEFQTFLRGKQEGLLVSEKEKRSDFHFLHEFGTSLNSDLVRRPMIPHSFDPFSFSDWSGWFSTDNREKNSLPVAIRFIEEIGNETNLRKLLQKTLQTPGTDSETTSVSRANTEFPSGNTSGNPSLEKITWGEMLNNRNFLATVFSESAELETPRIFIDWFALRRVGIFPTTPIPFLSETSDRIAGHRVLENTGLSLLFLDERSLLITSTLNAAKYQWGLRSLLGNRIKVMRDGPLANRFREAISGVSFPQWIPLASWNNRSSSQIHPWGNTSPSSQIASTAVGWNALELRRTESENGVYIAYRPMLVALHWFVFLFFVVVSRWKPFSNLVVLAIFAGVFGGLAVTLPLYYAVIPAGAFFGTLCGIAFALIRRDVPKSAKMTQNKRNLTIPTIADESTDAEYEVRELRPFNASPHKQESFFDTIQSETQRNE